MKGLRYSWWSDTGWNARTGAEARFKPDRLPPLWQAPEMAGAIGQLLGELA